MNLVLHNHDSLKTPAAKVENIPDFERMAGELEALRKILNAVGLAAPQCGASVQLFVTRMEACPVVFNPTWRSVRPERTSRPEATLSKPGMSWFVPRFDYIYAEWYDLSGQYTQGDLSLNDARVFQHMAQYFTGRQIWDSFRPAPLSSANQNQDSPLKT